MEMIYAFDENSEFQKTLKQVFEKTQDLTIPLTLIAKSWYRSNRSIFAIKGAGRYVDLSERYKKQKQKRWGFVYPILKASGDLAESITDPSSPNAVHYIVNKNTLVLGTSIPYAVYHQSQEPRTKIPYRPFLFVGVEQIAPNDIKNNRLKTWFQILDSYLTQKVK